MNDAILKFRRYEDAPLAYTAPNRHASDTRIGLMDSTVPESRPRQCTYLSVTLFFAQIITPIKTSAMGGKIISPLLR